MNEFKKLNLSVDVLKAIDALNFKEPTEVQIKSIPKILAGDNLIVQSATGTGKTIAFLGATISKIKPEKKAQILIITPTRELAIQILSEAIKLSKFSRTFSSAIYGGDSISRQASELRNADIVIGTPGRLIDQMGRKNLKLHNLKYVILDEADRMCDMGFFNDISKIFDKTSEEKQILLFSATITRDVEKLKRKYIKKSEQIIIDSYVDPNKLIQEYYIVKENNKLSLMVDLLKKNKGKKSLLFCNTRSEVDLLYHNFKIHNIECFKLHGGLEQRTRTNTIAKYHKHETAVLISTDVSARGIHVDNLEFIYNFDIPREYTQYVHRIGRTARAGNDGVAITLINKKLFETYKKMCRHFKFKPIEKSLPNYEILSMSKPERQNSRPRYTNSKVKNDRLKSNVFGKRKFGSKPRQFNHKFLEDITAKDGSPQNRSRVPRDRPRDFRDRPRDFKDRRRDFNKESSSRDRFSKTKERPIDFKDTTSRNRNSHKGPKDRFSKTKERSGAFKDKHKRSRGPPRDPRDKAPGSIGRPASLLNKPRSTVTEKDIDKIRKVTLKKKEEYKRSKERKHRK